MQIKKYRMLIAGALSQKFFNYQNKTQKKLRKLIIYSSLVSLPFSGFAEKTSTESIFSLKSIKNKIFASDDPEQSFHEVAKNPPKKHLKVEFQTETQTYASGTDFVLTDEGFIWFRERNNQEQDWTVLYFDGFPDEKPVKIQGDGANFIAISDQNKLHYKKIAKTELLVFELDAKESKFPKKSEDIARVHNQSHEFAINKRGFIWVRNISEKKPSKWSSFYFAGWPDKSPVKLDLEDNVLTIHCSDHTIYTETVSQDSLNDKLNGQNFPYQYHFFPSKVDVIAENNWKPWFSLPGISDVANALHGSHLKLPDDTADFAISNRGHESAFVVGAAGEQHRVAIEVTTFYLRRKGENFISFSDPWLLPNKFQKHDTSSLIYDKIIKKLIGFQIEVPTNFQIEKFCASASTLFIHGKNTLTNEDELYVRLVDYDTEAINPFLKYGYLSEIKKYADKNKIDPDIRFLPDGYKDFSPDQLWTPISLDGLGEGVLDRVDFKQMNIVQTGQGPQARDLFIAGMNADNKKGYYKKSLSHKEDPWLFFPFSEMQN